MMSASESEAKEKFSEKDEKQENQLLANDEEDDCEGFFLEPAGSNVNVAEKIAEANKKLFEEKEEKESRPRKVQFSDDIINFEPAYYSDDEYAESAGNSITSEDAEIKSSELPAEKIVTVESGDVSDIDKKSEGAKADETEEIPEEIIKEVISLPEDFPRSSVDKNDKFILVLIPKEQNSSCESIIGEEIAEEIEEKETKLKPEKLVKKKLTRPKSAKKSCEVSKISPFLNYSSNMDRRSWHTPQNTVLTAKPLKVNKNKGLFAGEMKIEIKKRGVKHINIGGLENVKPEILKRCCDSRQKSSYIGNTRNGEAERPKSALLRRTCCVIKTELPNYNGLRSEYGLSAEQLKERNEETLKIAKQKNQAKTQEKQEEIRKREKNEEIFQKWLFSKVKKSSKKKSGKVMDTLTRSDVYIQTHAVYATKRSVPYAVDYNVNRKFRENRVKQRKFLVEKFLDELSPCSKRSFNICLGSRP